jgi:hypothetical protein
MQTLLWPGNTVFCVSTVMFQHMLYECGSSTGFTYNWLSVLFAYTQHALYIQIHPCAHLVHTHRTSMKLCLNSSIKDISWQTLTRRHAIFRIHAMLDSAKWWIHAAGIANSATRRCFHCKVFEFESIFEHIFWALIRISWKKTRGQIWWYCSFKFYLRIVYRKHKITTICKKISFPKFSKSLKIVFKISV